MMWSIWFISLIASRILRGYNKKATERPLFYCAILYQESVAADNIFGGKEKSGLNGCVLF